MILHSSVIPLITHLLFLSHNSSTTRGENNHIETPKVKVSVGRGDADVRWRSLDMLLPLSQRILRNVYRAWLQPGLQIQGTFQGTFLAPTAGSAPLTAITSTLCWTPDTGMSYRNYVCNEEWMECDVDEVWTLQLSGTKHETFARLCYNRHCQVNQPQATHHANSIASKAKTLNMMVDMVEYWAGCHIFIHLCYY